jgi:catechol 2,3-dioxygenase-like lactoylglutathione lyase family enzyme
MLFVADPERSVAFYQRLGFTVGGTHAEGDRLQWVWLKHGGAQLMLARASAPVVAGAQAIMLYLYGPDVPGPNAELAAAGVEVGAITTPFYAPRGEFRVVDPDGYALMFTHDD